MRSGYLFDGLLPFVLMTSPLHQLDSLNKDLIAQYFTSREIVITLSIASISILFYDYFLTISTEYKHFWTQAAFQKLSYATPLFFVTRYSVFADTGLFLTSASLCTLYIVDSCAYKFVLVMVIRPTEIETCRTHFGAAAWLFLIGVCAAEAVLSLRTFALWNCRVLIRRILGILCAGVGIAEIFLVMHFIESLEFAPLELGRGCIVISTERDSMILGFALVMIYDTVILVLTMIRAFTTLRHNHSALIFTLYRDGVVFYFCLFIVTLANVLVAQYTSLPSSICLIVRLQRVAHAIFTSRIMLNLAQVPRVNPSSHSISTRLSIREAIDTTVTFFGKEAQFGIDGELVSLPPIDEEEGVWEVEMDDDVGGEEKKDE